MNWRRHRVIISSHAWERWRQRVQPKAQRKKVTKLITAKLNAAVRVGMPLGSTGAGWLRIKQGLWANVRLTNRGWIVTTFIVPGAEKAEKAVV